MSGCRGPMTNRYRSRRWTKRLRHFRALFDMDKDYVYAIFNQEETQVLGGSGLHTRLGKDVREIGYWIHIDHINQRYATETSAALTKVAFEIEGMDRVEIHCSPENPASATVPRKSDSCMKPPCDAAVRSRTVSQWTQ